MKPSTWLQAFGAVLCCLAGCEYEAEISDGDAGRTGADPWPEFETELCGEASRTLCSVPLAEPDVEDGGAEDSDSGVQPPDGGSPDGDGPDGTPDANQAEDGAADDRDDAVVWCAVSCFRPCGQDDRWQCFGQPVCSTDRDARPPSCGDIEERLDAGRLLRDTGTDANIDADGGL